MDNSLNSEEIQNIENQLLELENSAESLATILSKRLDLGKAYLEKGELEKAKEQFQTIVESEQNDIKGSAFHQLANLYFRLDDLKSSKENYQKAISYYTDNEQFSDLGNVYNLLASAFTQEKDFKTALPYFEKSIELNCKYLNYNELGKTLHNLRVLVSEGMVFKNQKIYYEGILEKEGFEAAKPFIAHNLGLWYYHEQEYDIAQKYFETARQTKENEDIHYELGNDYYHLGSIYEMQGKQMEALDYHKIALEKMLAQKEYDFIGVTIYFLQHSLDEIKDEEKKTDIKNILQEAENQGIILQSAEEVDIDTASLKEEETEEIDFSNTLNEVVKQESGKSLEETYQILKAGLPETAEQFAETAFDLVEKLQSNYQKSWFSKKSKKQIFENKKTEVLEILAQYLSLKEWFEQIEKFD